MKTEDIGSAAIEQSLFEKRQKVYPRQVHGLFAALRVAAVVVLLGLFYGIVWANWDGRPAVLFDLPARKFYVFWLTLWPQDFLLLALLMVIAALSLFLFTALAGRLWCGYACPQTVWTEVFLWMERIIEGDRAKRMKLDHAPWSLRRLRIKATKQVAWISFSALTGFTFVAYFTPARELVDKVMTLSLGPWELFWIVFYSFATYGNAGYMREQVCKYMCPYARFQSAMFDKDTWIVSYDAARGEPRGSRRSDVTPASVGLGDCINCTLCVQVCPTGIDIRDGLQYECIGCSSCIDVCNSVMDKMGYARGLVRYTTEHALEGNPSRIVRPRVLIYAAMLTFFGALLLVQLLTRDPIAIDIIRDRNQLYRERAGLIENVFTLKVLNLGSDDARVRISVDGIPDVMLAGAEEAFTVEAGAVRDVAVIVRAAEERLAGRRTPITFRLEAPPPINASVSETTNFLGPMP